MTGRDVATHYPPANGRPTVVLLATLIAGGWVWEAALSRLRERGFGCIVLNEPCASEHDNIAALVAQLFMLMDRHGVERATVVGASLGSVVAIESAATHPERVRSIVISGAPTLRRPDLGIVNTGRVTLQNAVHIAEKLVHDRRCVTTSMVESTFHFFQSHRRLLNLTRLLRQSSEYDAASRLPSIACDVLMLWGENDQISRCEDWQPFVPLARRGSFVRLQNCGHSPMIERPDDFNAALLAHLDAASDVSASTST